MELVYPDTRYMKLSDGQVVRLQYTPGNFVARSPDSNISVGDLFFDFSVSEREFVIHHEQFHQTQPGWQSRMARINRVYGHQLEFAADYHALQKTDRERAIYALERMKGMVKAGRLYPTHEIVHPPIEERILRIKSA